MSQEFAKTFTLLRHVNGLSQRQAASELNISQALLSHYENGLREPRLDFVVKACEYYGVSADYMLGMTAERDDDRSEFLDYMSKILSAVKSRYGEKTARETAEFLKIALYEITSCTDKSESAMCREAMARAETEIACAILPGKSLKEWIADKFPAQYEKIQGKIKAR